MNQDKYYEIAGELYNNKEYARAIEILNKVHKKYPDDTDILVLLAGCYIEITRFLDAARILLIAAKIEPNEPIILYNLGYALLCSGRLDDAYKYFEKCLELNPPKEIKKMVQKMLKEKDYFKKNLDVNGCSTLEEEFEVYDDFIKAQEFLYSGKYDKSILLYNRILEVNPNHYQSIQNIGTAYILQNQPEKALPYFEKSNNLHPTDNLGIANLAYAYYKIGNIEKSDSYIKELESKIDKPILRDLIRIITILIEIKEYNLARKLIEESEYKNPQIVFFSGVLHALKKEYPEAKARFKMLSPISFIAHKYYEAVCLLENEKITEYSFEPKIIESTIDML